MLFRIFTRYIFQIHMYSAICRGFNIIKITSFYCHFKYRKVASSSRPRLVARLSQQHPQKGQRFKQQHVSVSSYNDIVSNLVGHRYNSKVIYFSYQNVGSSRIPIRFFSIFIYPRGFLRIMIRYIIIKNATSKDFTQFCDENCKKQDIRFSMYISHTI